MSARPLAPILKSFDDGHGRHALVFHEGNPAGNPFDDVMRLVGHGAVSGHLFDDSYVGRHRRGASTRESWTYARGGWPLVRFDVNA